MKIVVFLVLFFASTLYAREGLSICNKTSEDFYVLKGSQGYRHPNLTEGWYFIKKGTCERVK
ncbi:DUF1036 domain-containing protein [Marinomonas rhizomae]|uniref:Uncharacterized protein DUF1036 n=1 Tax=Marinomonas rhizomae TaxID=491948 RepID=A0A366J9J7_9GAMM|nr:uncharacterized protein DUF1036 [Marinomonas rhizomae]RNF74076.1 DUF1036 domain-containing protein [Marinomonas rhizomae]